MKYSKKEIINHIEKIRKEIGHKETQINIKDLLFNDEKNELWIVTLDRPDKSAIIGKGGWVVGKLKENLNLNKIHVESYSDFLVKKYQLELSLNTLKSFISPNNNFNKNKNNHFNENNKLNKNNHFNENNNLNKNKKNDFNENNNLNKNKKIIPLDNLKVLLENKINNIYNFDLNSYLNETNTIESDDNQAIVALSGGVDSSFSLILAKYLGFNPIAITVDPGTIILPNQFKHNINKLCNKLKVPHQYIKVDYEDIIQNSLKGKFHPCGRCSKNTEETIFKFAANNNIDIVIFGDMLSTGTQCITMNDVSIENDKKPSKSIARLNLPATLSIGKEEIKSIVNSYELISIKGFGCPLLYEVHKNYSHTKKFSIQRILRETRSGALEPGEALDLIWSFYKLK